MATIKDILEIESARDGLTGWAAIHLFQEGSFYRAYERSAWLCQRTMNTFKVTHRKMKAIEQTVVFVAYFAPKCT